MSIKTATFSHGRRKGARISGVGMLPAASLLPGLFVIIDLALRHESIFAFSGKDWGFYLFSLVVSVALWYGFPMVFAWCGGKWHKTCLTAQAGCALFASFWMVSSYGFLLNFDQPPNYQTFTYIFDNPLNFYTLVAGELSFTTLVAVAVVAAVVFVVVRALAKGHRGSRHGLPAKVIPIFVCLLGLGVMNNNMRFHDGCFVPDMNLLGSALRAVNNRLFGSGYGRMGLHAAGRIMLPRREARISENVLIILNESLRGNDYTRESSPAAFAWIDRLGERGHIFPRAKAVSTSTLTAFPCMVTGVGPQASVSEGISIAPTMWDMGASAGLLTAYLSSHSLDWGGLDNYLSNLPIEVFGNKESWNAPRLNDLGTSDSITVSHLLHWLDTLAHDRSFLAMLHLNDTHIPYLSLEKVRWTTGETKHGRYLNSIRCVDYHVDLIFRRLKETGRLEKTTVFFTSDHGEAFQEHGYSTHTVSFYEEEVSVPLWMVASARVNRDHGEALKNNRERLVSNLDITPTLAGILHAPDSGRWRSTRDLWDGLSLLRPIPGDRPLIMLNNNEVARQMRENVGLLKNDCKMILSKKGNHPFLEVFELGPDPGEKRNVAASVSGDLVREYLGLWMSQGASAAQVRRIVEDPDGWMARFFSLEDSLTEAQSHRD